MLVVYPLAHVAYHTLYILSVTAPSKAPHSYLAMLGETWMESFKSCMAFGAFEVDETILVLPVVVLTRSACITSPGPSTTPECII